MLGEDKDVFLKRELCMFYNVENLFLPDPPTKHKLDPTVSGLRNWDERRYQDKLQKIARVCHLAEEQEGVLPMLIGLSEVYGEQNLKDLTTLEPLKGKYGIVHYDSMDERGLDTALLYDHTKLEVIASEAISFVFEKEFTGREGLDTTRDVLYCKLKYEEEILNVYVMHLPSKREKDINKPKRDFILKSIKERIVRQHSNEAVIVGGDFNEDPTAENMMELLLDEKGNTLLENPFVELYHRKAYSTYHHQYGLLFDQVLLSPRFFLPYSALRFRKATVFNSERLSSKEKKFKGRPSRTYAGTRYLGGCSDHFPVWIALEKNNLKNN